VIAAVATVFATALIVDLKPGQRTASAGERKERIQGAVRKATGVTRVREWRGGCQRLFVQFVSGFEAEKEFCKLDLF